MVPEIITSIQMIRLKNYIDFIISLTEMVEVKEGKFTPPTEILFKLPVVNHRELYREVLLNKNENVDNTKLIEPFEVEILGINLKFEHE